MIGINAVNDKGLIVPFDIEVSSLEKAQELLNDRNLKVDPVLTLKNYFDTKVIDRYKEIIYVSEFIYKEDFCKVIETIEKNFNIELDLKK